MPASAPRADQRAVSSDGLGLYVHWPFCRTICPYCDFNVRRAGAIDQTRWARALLADLDHAAERAVGRRLDSLYFGGGTPSLMPAATVAAVIDRAADRFAIDPGLEISLEANPSSADTGAFAAFRDAGVNRLSLGVQALADDALAMLGRDHDAAEARTAIDAAHAAFPRVSFDLIYARPGQTPAAWRRELGEGLTLAGGHISLYQLTIEPETAFARARDRGSLAVPGTDAVAGLYEVAQEMCEAAGLPAYEVSNHAALGHESRHNLGYWRYDEYLGIGPGAHGRLIENGSRQALEQIRRPDAWLAAVERAGHGTGDSTRLTPAEQASELLLMGLRLAEGVSLARFHAIAGITFDAFAPPKQLARLEAEGLVVREDGYLRVTRNGRSVLDGVVQALLP